MQIRVSFDVQKPLKRKIKPYKPGGDWSGVTFKYERLNTFCFLYDILGHSKHFYSQAYDVGEK